ncbi:MAG: sugar-binding domain-containing protein, partial [Verrucomicrobiota bacterium]
MKNEADCMSGEGLWDFAFLGNIPLETADPSGADFSEKMPVPGSFDALPAYAGKLGVAVYRKQFHVPSGRRARLEFGAVSRWSRVYVDQQPLVENACAYAPFEVDLPVADHAQREIVVMVDNRFDFERAPLNLDYVDYYQYGGIIRNVRLH